MKLKSTPPFGLRRLLLVCALTLGSSFAQTSTPDAGGPNPTDDGYRGIWFTLGQVQEFGDKYSGGLGTYTANHVPIAIYAKAVNKTFFVYGGSKGGKRQPQPGSRGLSLGVHQRPRSFPARLHLP
jgi:hypothetical protein